MLRNWFFSKMSRRHQWFSILTFSTFLISSPLKAAWDWQKSPSEAAWKSFIKMPQSKKAELWKKLTHAGTSFENLAWEWRLAWVKACSISDQAWCSSILQYGLFDRALVVRAETAARLGDRFAGTGHKPALRLLATAYAVQQNRKASARAPGEPLYVQYRILHAIKQIGGASGLQLGERLAQDNSGTADYWKLLAGNERTL